MDDRFRVFKPKCGCDREGRLAEQLDLAESGPSAFGLARAYSCRSLTELAAIYNRRADARQLTGDDWHIAHFHASTVDK
jgi:hypothetical protein